MTLAEKLRQIDYQSLPISDYSHRYIQCLLPILDYYLDICQRALDLLPSSTHTLVDYGGGHGFLSLLAKQRGFKQVIYIDYNPQASETVTALAKEVGFGPDVILTGDSNTLKTWSQEQQIFPDALIGIDIIEHIYRLDTFFDDLLSVNPGMAMVFSTASTPYNPWVKRRLHRFMLKDELGTSTRKGFLHLRREHIATLRPDLSPDELDRWAAATRGLTYPDITATLTHSHIPESPHSCIPAFPNTCDPATGSWTERILPLKEYRSLAAPRRIILRKGFYNAHRPGTKGMLSSLLNKLLRLPGTQVLAPFIILQIKAK